MSFLLVAGLELGDVIAEPAGIKEARREIGETTAAYDGTLRKSRQRIKRDMEFATVPMVSATALAWELLLRGFGEVWSFDASLYGSKGLGPSASSGAALIATHPKFGAKNLELAATTGTITYSAELGANWTVIVWRYESAAWHSYVIRSTEAGAGGWYDGVSDSNLTYAWLSVDASGSVTISNSSGAAVEYDDLVLLPFVVPSGWPPVFGLASSAFSALPRLTISGDAVPEAATRTVMGEATPSFVKAVIGGSLVSNGRILAVTLSEV